MFPILSIKRFSTICELVFLNLQMNDPHQPRLLERVRRTLPLKQMSLKTEKSYLYYIKRLIIAQKIRVRV
jgi:hypothetical protein